MLEKSKTLTRYPGLVAVVCLAMSAPAAYAIDLNALTINGYFIAKPVRIAELERVLRTWTSTHPN